MWAALSTGTNDAQSLHRIDPAVVRKEVEAAGFVPEAQRNLLAKKGDPHSAKRVRAFDQGRDRRLSPTDS
jgi:predicted methyltransferase